MQESTKPDIRSLTQDELCEFFLSHGDKPFRAKQVWEWLWKKSARSFDDMTNISFATRQFLKDQFTFAIVQPASILVSKDKTIKTAFRLCDNSIVEGALIPAESRMTACVSSQVGCSLACKFCATGRLGFIRNLTFDEIYDQVSIIAKQAQEHYNHHLSNIVFMGMGEPLLNYSNLLKAIERITSPNGLGMSPSRVTVSTVGLAKMIKQLGDDGVKFNLALSLHAANDKKRSEIIPVNEQNSLKKLAEAVKYYHSKTNNRITFEYLILDRFNDTLADAKELAEFCKNVPCKVNIIEYNYVEETGFRKASDIKVKAFAGFLETKNIIVNIRKSRGEDIAAACGQLANKLDKR
ncbi:MAG: 23S rRNA (adenine(2503)-C(2))-methyltransferase RlmN [Bacteroidales bacterium]